MGINTYTELNCGQGGSIMDEIGLDYGDTTPLPDSCATPPPGSTVLRRRAKVVIAGKEIDEISSVTNGNQKGDEYSLAVRTIDRAYDQSIYEFSEATSVNPDTGAGTYTTVTSYTVPVGKSFSFTGVVVGGDIGAKFKVAVNGNTSFILRTANTNPTNNLGFKTPPFQLNASDTITVSVLYYSDIVTLAADFEATILGYIF